MSGHRNTKKAKNAERGVRAASSDPELAITPSHVGERDHIAYSRTYPDRGIDAYRLTAKACRSLGLEKK